MTDDDVRREIEANQQRAIDIEHDAEDDGTIVDSAEKLLDPLIDPFVPDANDDAGETLLDPEEAARNDAEQRGS
jgi:hypothetical protein